MDRDEISALASRLESAFTHDDIALAQKVLTSNPDLNDCWKLLETMLVKGGPEEFKLVESVLEPEKQHGFHTLL